MARRKSGQDVHGILLLDKRLGVSSNQALQEVRRLFNANKAGHSGSLDPLATGLLPLCFGEATKVCALMLEHDKAYLVTIKLGVMTDTGDAEGQVIANMPVPALSQSLLMASLQHFTGDIEQVPPMYSALKHQGKKLYELARAGITIERPARKVKIHSLELVEFTDDLIKLQVYCSKGTYIRSLAEDLGSFLGCCATVTALRRIASGLFSIDNAITLEHLRKLDDQARLQQLLAVDFPLTDLPSVQLSTEQALKLKQGQQILLSASDTGIVRIYHQTTFLGLGELLLNGKLAPRKLFQMDND